MAGKHRVIREIRSHPVTSRGNAYACFSCGASVADIEGHIRWHAEQFGEEIELDVNAGAVPLTEFDAPDSWQRAELEEAARDQARSRGEKFQAKKAQRRRQALEAEMVALRQRAAEIKRELADGGEERGANAS